MVSSFLSSLADNSQDCALYSSPLRTQASKILICLGIFILLSVRTFFLAHSTFGRQMKCVMLDNGKDVRRCW